MTKPGFMHDHPELASLSRDDLQRINPMNWMQSTTRNAIWDVIHKEHDNAQVSLNTTALMAFNAKYAASCMDALAPMIEQHGAGLPIVLDAMSGRNGATVPVADAFDRVVEFTLYCNNTCVANVMDWCSANEIPKFIVEDDRGGTGSWKINFTYNGSKIIDSLNKLSKEYGIDVLMNLNWAA